MTNRRVDRDTVDHADAVTGASKNAASEVFIVVEDVVLLVDSVASEETCLIVVFSIWGVGSLKARSRS